MKQTALGKSLFFILISWLANAAFAQNSVAVSKTQFYPGDVITFTINARGNSIKFPSISAIAGHPIIGNSSSTSIEIVNGKKRQIKSQSYSFKPTKSLTIGAFILQINSKQERTKPIALTLLKPTKSKQGDDFILRMKVNKTEIFLGEKIDLQIILKQKKSVALKADIQISQLKVKGLSLKPSKDFVISANKNYKIYTQNSEIIAHRAGVFTLKPIKAILNANAQNFLNVVGLSQQVPSEKIYSNSINLKVNALPDNLTLYGDFDIKTLIDKAQLQAGEALNLTLKITGKGNLTDLEKFALEIKNATIYTDEPMVKNQQWSQKFAIVAQEDFVIPAFNIEFFDKRSHRKKRISTEEIKIQVSSAQALPNLQSTPTLTASKPQPSPLKYYYLLTGILLGMGIVGLIFAVKRIKRPRRNQDLINKIKSARGDKALFDLLLPLNRLEFEPFLQQLEGNLYKNQNNKISKKRIISSLRAK